MYHIQPDLSEKKVVAILRRIIFRRGRLHCPRCGSHRIWTIRSEGRYHCPRCRKKFSVLSGTWLKNVKIPLAFFVILPSFWLEDVTVELAVKLTGFSRPTIYRYYALFRKHIVQTLDFTPQNNVQVDEAYFGQFKKQANYFHGKRTYQVVAKTCVAGIACPTNGTLATQVIERKPGQPIKAFIRELVPENIVVYSDGSPIYTALRTTHLHIPQTHDRGFDNAYYIESCWSWMKRKLFKQYHHFTRKYAKEYVRELTFKYNTRKTEKNPLYYISKSL